MLAKSIYRCLDLLLQIRYDPDVNSDPCLERFEASHGVTLPCETNTHRMKYEMMYIVPATKSDDEAAKAKEETTTLLGQYSEEITRDDMIGKRKLAYPIKHVRYGYYVLTCFTADPEKVKDLDRELRHSADVLRHMIVAAGPNADSAEVELPEYEQPDVYARRKRSPKKDEKPVVKREEVVEAAKDEAPAKEEAVKPAMSSEQLDKKIDDILEADVDKA